MSSRARAPGDNIPTAGTHVLDPPGREKGGVSGVAWWIHTELPPPVPPCDQERCPRQKKLNVRIVKNLMCPADGWSPTERLNDSLVAERRRTGAYDRA